MEKRFKPLKRITIPESDVYISADEDFQNNFISFYTLEKIDNEWDNVKYFTKRTKKSIPSFGEGKEIIYVMSNPSMPNLIKIGYTGKEIEIRRSILSKPTGVPTPFKIEYFYRLQGRGMELEREIHKYLKEYRLNNDREFFELTLKQAIDAINFIGKNYI